MALKAKRVYDSGELKALYAINESIVNKEHILKAGDTIKIFGLFMGG